ncbi:MAG: PAS domain-containing protein [Cyanobacteriota bacterium]
MLSSRLPEPSLAIEQVLDCLGAIALGTHQTQSLDDILNTAVQEVYKLLQIDRFLIYRFQPDGSGVVVAESVSSSWTSVISQTINDPCFTSNKTEAYRQGHFSAVADIYADELQPCYVELLAQFQVRANLVVPILSSTPPLAKGGQGGVLEMEGESNIPNQLWGLLIAHHCSDARQWKPLEVKLLQQVALQIAIAIQQTQIYQQTQTEQQQRQEAQAKQQASEQFLHSIYDGAANAIFVVDVLPSGEFRFAGLNPADEQLTGLRVQEVLGKTPEQVLPPEAAAAVSANYTRCVQAGTTITYEECLPFQGEETWWLTTLTPLRDAQSRIYQLTGTSINISDRKQTEESLRIQQEFLGNVIDTNPNLICVKDWEGKFKLVNQALADIYGTTVEDLIGKTDTDFNSNRAEVEQYLQDDREVMTTLQGKCIPEETLTSANGEVHYLQTIKKPLLSPDGKARYVLVTATDITARKRAEQQRDKEASERHRLFQQIEQQNQTLETEVQERTALLSYINKQLLDEIRERQRLTAQIEQQARTLDTVLYASPDDIYMFDRAGCYLYANSRALQSMSVFLQKQKPLQLSEIVGKTGYELGFPTELMEPHKARLEQVFVTGEPLTGEFSHPRNKEIRYRDSILTPLYDSGGTVEKIVVTSRDITERKRAELALQESNQQITNILESITDAFLALNGEWQFTYMNPKAEQLLQRRQEELLGNNVWDEFPEAVDLIFYREYHRAISEQVSVAFEEFYQPLNSWFEVHAYPTRDGLAVYFRDITERKKANDRIKTSLQEKETLLKEIHHRVKNNLQVISSLLRLQSRQIRDQQVLDLFKDSQNRVQAMALIHELLYQSPNLAQIEFQDYIQTLVGNLCRSYDAQKQGVTVNINVEQVYLNLDTAIPCGLIINELVSNSLKHAFPQHQGGEICISFHASDKGQFILRVSDNGVGMGSDFDFHNTRSLGLQLVFRLTKQLEGSIELNHRQKAEFKIVFSIPHSL